MPKLVNVRVTSVESELEFAIHPSTTGKQLFDQVVKTIGMREVWYFGLQYVDARGELSWISLNKKVMQHDLNKEQTPLHFRFRVKFYPEDAAHELVQEITQRFFYLEVKELVLRDEIYCSPETAVLLASYSAQVKFGDQTRDLRMPGILFAGGVSPNTSVARDPRRNSSASALTADGSIANPNDAAQAHAGAEWLPLRVFAQHNFSRNEWEDKVLAWWGEHVGLMRDDAMLEYLKIAQDLEMYGVTYYEIKNKKGTDLWLGIDSLGLNIYENGDKLTPRIGFPWSEIKHVAFSDKKFLIESVDKKSPKFFFFASRARVNKRILALCMGNHELYMRRRRPESIEIQQMRIQAAEERAARLRDRAVYDRERRAREDIERQRGELEARLRDFEAQAVAANRTALETSERLRALEEKYAAALRDREELEAARQRAEELHARLMREVTMEQEEKRKLLDEYEQARRSAERKQKEISTKESELSATKFELDEMRRQLAKRNMAAIQIGSDVSPDETALSRRTVGEQADAGEYDQEEAHFELTLVNGSVPQPELSRQTAIASNSRLQDQLLRLGAELRANRDDRIATQADRLHDQNIKLGRDKFKTLKQIRQGNTKKRVDEFEAM